MISACVQYVHEHPPRCIAGLRPQPTSVTKPTVLLPPHLSIYYNLVEPTETASFVIGCPCGNRAARLLGYYTRSEGRNRDTIFVGPLALACPECGTASEVFDSRKHGYDGEQGGNTHILGEGNPDECACPRCGATRMIFQANFSYQGVEDYRGEMQERLQDFFGTLDIIGKCTRCGAIIEIAWFECD